MAATGLKSIEWLTAAWLAQLGEGLSAEREVTGSNPGRTNTIHIMGWVGTVSSQMDWERLPVGPLYVAHVRAYYWHVKMYCKRARLLSYHRRLFIHSFHSLTHSFIHSFIHSHLRHTANATVCTTWPSLPFPCRLLPIIWQVRSALFQRHRDNDGRGQVSPNS